MLKTRIHTLPYELLDVITSYLPNKQILHVIPFVSKDFLNAHLYRIKIGRIALTTKVHLTKIKTGHRGKCYIASYNKNDKLMPWNTFLKDNNICKDFSLFSDDGNKGYNNIDTIDYNNSNNENSYIIDKYNEVDYNIYDFNSYDIHQDFKLDSCDGKCLHELTNDKLKLLSQDYNNYSYRKRINYDNYNHMDMDKEDELINANDNTVLYNLLYTCNRLTVRSEDIEEVMKNIKYTNIDTLIFKSDAYDNIKVGKIYVPSNITSLKIENVKCESITFSPDSKLKTIELDNVTSDTYTVLPNTTESITCMYFDSVDCNFDNLKYLNIFISLGDDKWLKKALNKVTGFVYLSSYISENAIYLLRAKKVRLQTKYIENIHKDVESLCLLHDLHYDKKHLETIKSFKKLKSLTMNLEHQRRSPMNIELDNLEALTIYCPEYEKEINDFVNQNVNIQCKNLKRLTLVNCDVEDVHGDNIEYLELNGCSIKSINFPKLKVKNIFNTNVELESD